ncbi:MAG: hypothetical protein FWD35_01245 [Oscillospiraceae bacterium]|nr:hypothetical protein [Oscillospiraceae bacterium]
MSSTPLHDFLKSHTASGVLSCHTPGHKGLMNPHDITEFSDEAVDVIRQSERRCAELFGAERSLFSTSGSTLAIYAMLAPFAGGRISAVRGVHRSVIDAAILLDIDIVWSDTPHGDCSAHFITNIDYYGNVAKIPQDSPVPILVDNAHGAYLVFTDSHPLKRGAEYNIAMVAESAHKTLPALTGAAYLHIADSRYVKPAEDALQLFGTSSPSYLILESLDLCNAHIALEKHKGAAAFGAAAELKQRLTEWGYKLKDSDLLRVVIDCNAYGYDGRDYARELAQRGIIGEMSEPRYAILLFSTITEQADTQRVFAAMKAIEQKPPVARTGCQLSTVNCQLTMRPREAYFAPKETLPIAKAIGRVCAGIHVTTPPCAALIIPGEIISPEIAALLKQQGLETIDVSL